MQARNRPMGIRESNALELANQSVCYIGYKPKPCDKNEYKDKLKINANVSSGILALSSKLQPLTTKTLYM